MANKAVSILKDKKAKDIKLMDIHEISAISDYFVIATGNSTIQVQAMSDELEEKMNLAGYEMHHKEGFRNGRWILLDFNNIIIHLFHDEERQFYNLERLWVDAKTILVDNE
ncbi:MAG TPA: ribosome silencing factor [Bacillota bacterium]|nr:ribosome silencing factor [Bacillota bacterium]HOR86020.1 ribosome silencing factor [Bacillota bacterium]HPL52902.1 ribosome silencing factor [Bacillota bacterium]